MIMVSAISYYPLSLSYQTSNSPTLISLTRLGILAQSIVGELQHVMGRNGVDCESGLASKLSITYSIRLANH